jgi:hypothetical protein
MREEAEEGGEEIDEEETQGMRRGRRRGVAFLAMMTGIALRESVIDTLSVMTSVV